VSRPAAGSAADAGSSSFTPTPLRAAPRILRLWIKPWEDADQDLNGETLIYVQVDAGHWMVDHVQRKAREAYAPVRPAKQASAPADNPDAPGKDGRKDSASVSQALRALQARDASRAIPD
jgi:conjugal transfer pilus assembly protein TraV